MTDIPATPSATWQWIAHTDAGLALRITLGVVFFACLSLVDLRRHGRRATRWREHVFLFIAVCIALIYGVINVQFTSRISWEYFYYGKGLSAILGDHTPPDSAQLSWEAAKIGLKATWTVGLLVGVAMLMANNPKLGLPQLTYPALLRQTSIIFLITFACAALLGMVGCKGGLTRMSDDFRQMVLRNEDRPYRFMAVYGIHLGGYVGGTLGTIWAVISVRLGRKALCRAGGKP